MLRLSNLTRLLAVKIEVVNGKCFSDYKHPVGGVLSGIRVLDLTRVLAGPFCTMILGDLGADIIKVENPKGGDYSRLWGPPFVKEESAYFLSINRNKKSVAIDMKDPKGRDLIIELAKKSDVLVENYVPGKLSAMGLDYESLHTLVPQLIYCSITGFGSSGPYATRPGLDVMAASIGGLLNSTGPKDGEPCKVGVAVTDLSTGLYAHGAIMAALLQRMKTGKGQKIDCNLLSTQVSMMVNIATNYLNAGHESRRWGTAHESVVPYQCFKTKDGYITLGAINNTEFRKLCKILNISHLLGDPRFSTNQDRVKNRDILISEMSNVLSKKTNSHWNEILKNSNIPFGPVNTMKDVFNDPQVIHNDMVQDMMHSGMGSIKVVGPAVKFSDSLNTGRLPPPQLGEHTDVILSQVLSMKPEEIEQLRKAKTIL